MTKMLKHLIIDIFENNNAKTNVFCNMGFEPVATSMMLAICSGQRRRRKRTAMTTNVARTCVFMTFPNNNDDANLVLQHFQI